MGEKISLNTLYSNVFNETRLDCALKQVKFVYLLVRLVKDDIIVSRSQYNMEKERIFMHKIYCLMLRCISAIALLAAVSTVNATCNIVLYEPEIPEELY